MTPATGASIWSISRPLIVRIAGERPEFDVRQDPSQERGATEQCRAASHDIVNQDDPPGRDLERVDDADGLDVILGTRPFRCIAEQRALLDRCVAHEQQP